VRYRSARSAGTLRAPRFRACVALVQRACPPIKRSSEATARAQQDQQIHEGKAMMSTGSAARDQWLAARRELWRGDTGAQRLGRAARGRRRAPGCASRRVRFDIGLRGAQDSGPLIRRARAATRHHFMLGPEFEAAARLPSIADGFNGFGLHLATWPMPLDCRLAGAAREAGRRTRRMGLTFSWASSVRRRPSTTLRGPKNGRRKKRD